MLKWDNKKRKNFNIYNVIFLKIIKKNTWRYHYFTPVYEKSRWNDLLLWDIEHEGLKSEVLGFFCPFTTSLPLKTYGYGVRQTKLFCHFRPLFAILPPRNPENQNFEKMKQNIWRYYHLTHVYHKWRSNDACFLRYGATDIIFCHFGPFVTLLPTYQPTKLKFLENDKNAWRY